MVFTVDVGEIKDVAQLVPAQPVEMGVVCIELGAEDAAADRVPNERVAEITQVFGKGAEVFGGVGEF